MKWQVGSTFLNESDRADLRNWWLHKLTQRSNHSQYQCKTQAPHEGKTTCNISKWHAYVTIKFLKSHKWKKFKDVGAKTESSHLIPPQIWSPPKPNTFLSVQLFTLSLTKKKKRVMSYKVIKINMYASMSQTSVKSTTYIKKTTICRTTIDLKLCYI